VASSRIVVVGAGVFGVGGALALKRRGHDVVLVDPGPVPHPRAASTDISKAVRMDYGADEVATVLMEDALGKWRELNATWPRPLFHETGVMFLSRAPMAPGSFEWESLQVLTRRGHPIVRLTPDVVQRRFPAWNAAQYVDGYFNPLGGYAESGEVVFQLAAHAKAAGVRMDDGSPVREILTSSGRVTGVQTEIARVEADAVVIAAGAWTPKLVPRWGEHFRTVGQPLFHLKPEDPTDFMPDRFPVFGSDISNTGYYGFPIGRAGVVKIANHGAGIVMPPDAPECVVTAAQRAHLRAHLAMTLPKLARAPIVFTRLCLYCDSHDGQFWIAEDPECEGLFVAAGGSGHAFKFAPLLGDWVADAVESVDSEVLRRFRWRPEARSEVSGAALDDAARSQR